MPIYHKAEMTRKKILHQTKKAHFFVLPLMALIFTPRILNLVLFFGVWRGFGCFVTFFGAVTIYTIGYVTLVFTKYKKEWMENNYPLVQGFLTSFFSPCIIMYPESKMVFFASLVSTIPHLILTSALIIMSKYFPDYLSSRLVLEAFDFLIPCLFIAPFFAWILQAFSQEKTQQILLNAINFNIVKFFAFTIVLGALDEISDILSAMDYFR